MRLVTAATNPRQEQEANQQTSLKLPIGQQQQQQLSSGGRAMMKFNWRANWEILLVFVIIIVGIVITTIAAIRSKDKHLLVTPADESLAAYSNGGGIGELTSSLQVPALPQNDFQLQNGLDDTGQDDGDETAAHNNGNLAASTRRPARPSTTAALSPASSSLAHRKRSHPNRPTEAGPSTGKPLASGLVTQTTTTRPTQTLSHHDNYEAAMSTEQTPSQTGASRQQPTPSSREEQRKKFEQTLNSFLNGKLVADSKHQQQNDEHFNDQLESQLENNQKGRVGSGTKHHFAHVTTGSDQQPQISMQGPYELAATLQHNLNRANNKMKLAQQQQNQEAPLKIEPMPSSSLPPSDLSEELMTSYTRVPQSQSINSTETLLMSQDRNLLPGQFHNKAQEGVSNNSTTTAGDSDDSDSTSAHLDNFNSGQTTGSLQQQHHLRAYPSSLPLEMLLNELIKLSPQPTSRPLMDAQAGLEQPANSRPQFGILQQLRSLPSPLLALFQQTSNQQNPAGLSNGGGQQNNGDFYANYHHLQPTNHDASESAQHYQRISMSPYADINSLVARSLRTTNPLPAFPPPKGVLTTWVPPNMGGVSILQDAASTNNADFVASETAGFVRGFRDMGLQMAASDVSQQQQDQPVPSNDNNNNSNQSHQTASQAQKSDETAIKQSRDQQASVPSTAAAANSASGKQAQGTSSDGSLITQQVSTLPLPPHQQTSGELTAAAAVRGQMPSPVLKSQINSVPVLPASGVSMQRYINQNRLLQQQPARQMQRSDQVAENGPLTRLFTSPKLVQSSIGAANHQQAGLQTMINSRQSTQLKILQETPNQRPSIMINNSPPQGQAIQLNTVQGRVKRSIGSNGSGKSSFVVSSRDSEQAQDEQEEYSDSSPLSIVTPDGKPLSANAAQFARAHRMAGTRTSDKIPSGASGNLDSASSQRETNHADLNESSPVNHYATELDVDADGPLRAPKRSTEAAGGHRNGETNSNADWRRHRRPLAKAPKDRPRSKSAKTKQRRGNSNAQRLQKLEAADSLLMSKLLGVASTNDELEDDLDGDDEESARERRKEELEDAEFGISSDDRSNSPPSNADVGSNSDEMNDANPENQDVGRLSQDNSAAASPAADRGSTDEMPPIRPSGSTDSNAYARRQQQQRSDVEFYGHPGEETRQLKYGILGSGNYEVVNGGIYPDIDESTAAVNSVANYVRKPGGAGGGSVLLAGLPKLINSVAVAAAAADDNRQVGRHRLSGDPGFMWGASATNSASDELNGQTLTNNPLLDMLGHRAHHQAAAEGQPIGDYYNPNLFAAQYLGSSGTSARTTHTSRDAEPSSGNDLDAVRQNLMKTKQKQRPKQRPSSNQDNDEGYNSSAGDQKDEPAPEAHEKSHKLKMGFKKDMMTPMETLNDANNRIRSSSTSSNDPQSSRKTNQLYSYHVFPSKKVTIFSDQDLDSTPSDLVQRVTRTRPSLGRSGHL